MNGLLVRRLCLQYKTSLVSWRQVLRHLNAYNDCRQLPANVCLNHCSQTLVIERSMTTSSSFTKLLAKQLTDISVQQKRFGKQQKQKWKKGKKGMKDKDNDDESEDEDDDEPTDELDTDLIDGKAIGFLDKNASIVSLRLDNVLKAGLNVARNKVDESFYAGLVRVNGQRVAKKSAELTERDEIDLIRGLNVENQDLLDVSRVVVKSIEDKMSSKDRIQCKLRIFRKLTIENYSDEPYDGYAINIDKDGKDDKDKDI